MLFGYFEARLVTLQVECMAVVVRSFLDSHLFLLSAVYCYMFVWVCLFQVILGFIESINHHTLVSGGVLCGHSKCGHAINGLKSFHHY